VTEEKKLSIPEAQRTFAAGIFNKAWELLETEKRTADEDELMINAAHASLYHWRKIGEPLNFQRGEWMVAHVYTILAMKESARHHSQLCLDLTEEYGFVDFDLGFAYEGYARAAALNGDKSICKKYYKLAVEAGEKIRKKGDRDYFKEVLEEGPWFEMR